MGKVVWSRRFGPDQTEWAVSVLPLGGYVKMLDARDPDTAPVDAGRAGARIHAPERVEAHRHRRRRPARQLPAGHRAVGRPVHGTARRSRRTRLRAMRADSAGLAGRRARRRRGHRRQRPAGRSLDRPALGARARRHRQARRRTANCAAPGGGSYRAVIPAATLAGAGRRTATSWRARHADVAPAARAWSKVLPDGAGRARRPARGRPGHAPSTASRSPTASTFIDAVRAAPGRSAAAGRAARRPAAARCRSRRSASRRSGPGRRSSSMVAQTPEMVTVQRRPAATRSRKGAQRTWDTSVMTLKMIGRMIDRRSLAEERDAARSPSPTSPARPRASGLASYLRASSPSSASVWV